MLGYVLASTGSGNGTATVRARDLLGPGQVNGSNTTREHGRRWESRARAGGGFTRRDWTWNNFHFGGRTVVSENWMKNSGHWLSSEGECFAHDAGMYKTRSPCLGRGSRRGRAQSGVVVRRPHLPKRENWRGRVRTVKGPIVYTCRVILDIPPVSLPHCLRFHKGKLWSSIGM